MPPYAEGTYNAFTDEIEYKGEPTQATITHEEVHKLRANNYEHGRWAWGVRYMTDPVFACNEEQISNLVAGIRPINDHPACDKLKVIYQEHD